jgi:hypothetical protein
MGTDDQYNIGCKALCETPSPGDEVRSERVNPRDIMTSRYDCRGATAQASTTGPRRPG